MAKPLKISIIAAKGSQTLADRQRRGRPTFRSVDWLRVMCNLLQSQCLSARERTLDRASSQVGLPLASPRRAAIQRAAFRRLSWASYSFSFLVWSSGSSRVR
jgi:hypothetical protein